MTLKEGLLPLLTEVRKIRYGKRFDYDDLVESIVSKSNVNQVKLAVKLNHIIIKRDINSETELLKLLFVH